MPRPSIFASSPFHFPLTSTYAHTHPTYGEDGAPSDDCLPRAPVHTSCMGFRKSSLPGLTKSSRSSAASIRHLRNIFEPFNRLVSLIFTPAGSGLEPKLLGPENRVAHSIKSAARLGVFFVRAVCVCRHKVLEAVKATWPFHPTTRV